MLAIGCGYPDGNDCDRLRFDPAFSWPADGCLTAAGDLCSQPTISRWENAPTLREIIRLTYALVDIWCRSYQKPPRSVVLDIDDTVDASRIRIVLASCCPEADTFSLVALKLQPSGP
jgi:Transposase DDE domain group 1